MTIDGIPTLNGEGELILTKRAWASERDMEEVRKHRHIVMVEQVRKPDP